MNSRLVVPAVAGLLMCLAAPALAQSGQIMCEQDVNGIEKMYREKEAALSDADRAEAQQLLQLARNKCQHGGPAELSAGRSKEASILLDKLQNIPSPSQAEVPRGR